MTDDATMPTEDYEKWLAAVESARNEPLLSEDRRDVLAMLRGKPFQKVAAIATQEATDKVLSLAGVKWTDQNALVSAAEMAAFSRGMMRVFDVLFEEATKGEH